jgi:hypothetical protein
MQAEPSEEEMKPPAQTQVLYVSEPTRVSRTLPVGQIDDKQLVLALLKMLPEGQMH